MHALRKQRGFTCRSARPWSIQTIAEAAAGTSAASANPARLTQAARRLARVPAEALAGFPQAWSERGQRGGVLVRATKKRKNKAFFGEEWFSASEGGFRHAGAP
jgi:hypothetical protein